MLCGRLWTKVDFCARRELIQMRVVARRYVRWRVEDVDECRRDVCACYEDTSKGLGGAWCGQCRVECEFDGVIELTASGFALRVSHLQG